MQAHSHDFSETGWPFDVPVSTAAFCTTRVARENFPILLVSHDENGDWQFLDDTTDEPEGCTLLCLGCAFELDRTLAGIADLPVGWVAWRSSIGEPWQRDQHPDGGQAAQ